MDVEKKYDNEGTLGYKIMGFMWTYHRHELTAPEQALMFAIIGSMDHKSKDHVCYAKASTLQQRAKISKRTYLKSIKNLLGRGLVAIEERPGTTNRYRVVWEKFDPTLENGSRGLTQTDYDASVGRLEDSLEGSANLHPLQNSTTYPLQNSTTSPEGSADLHPLQNDTTSEKAGGGGAKGNQGGVQKGTRGGCKREPRTRRLLTTTLST